MFDLDSSYAHTTTIHKVASFRTLKIRKLIEYTLEPYGTGHKDSPGGYREETPEGSPKSTYPVETN